MKGKPKGPLFLSLIDDGGLPYLAANAKSIKGIAALGKQQTQLQPKANLCTFLDDEIAISQKATSIFSSDLTSRDDVIIAILSLLLILAIESTFATILLNARHGSISNFGFSVRHFVELVRDFRFGALIKGHRTTGKQTTRRLNKRLLATAVFIASLTLGLEVLVLVLSNSQPREVTTGTATFQLRQAINPDWNKVREHYSLTLDMPCRHVIFEGVDGGDTTMVPCMTSDASSFQHEPFRLDANPVTVEIISDIHMFGIEHSVTIGNTSASYSARAYISKFDKGSSLLTQREQFYTQFNDMSFVHRQFVAYLFSAYQRETEDKNMGIDRLNDMKFMYNVTTGPIVDVIKLNIKAGGRPRQVVSVRHTTKFTGVIPSGTAAFRFASVVFRAAMAIEVSGPDFTALKRSNGNTIERELVIWVEEGRILNWLSLSILLCVALTILAALRSILKPVTTADIARVVVKHALY